MECRSPAEVVELLGPAACDALDAAERARLDHHLAICSECRGELITLRRVAERLAALRATGWRG